MRRLMIGLMLLAFCSPAQAEQTSPVKARGIAMAQAAALTPPVKPAPKKKIEKKKKKKAAPKGPPAKELFGSVAVPAPLAARSIGAYSKGCLAGGVALPINGPDWQVMRLSRNRNWGHPRLIDYLERLASDARAFDDWPGLLVGDLSQPRGGPMLTGHTSHQIGLDADIWLTPMPDRILTDQEREDISAVSMLKDPFTVDPEVWTPGRTKLIKRAASYPQVHRIFVHPAIKKILCQQAGAKNRRWLAKVRPWWNHYYHFHVRLSCPPGVAGCANQKPVAGNDGCGTELKNWYAMLRKSEIWKANQPPTPAKPATPAKSKKRLKRVADLPKDCKTVLASGGHDPSATDPATAPVALRAVASKDAGPPPPRLDAAALLALTGGKPRGMPLPDRNPTR